MQRLRRRELPHLPLDALVPLVYGPVELLENRFMRLRRDGLLQGVLADQHLLGRVDDAVRQHHAQHHPVLADDTVPTVDVTLAAHLARQFAVEDVEHRRLDRLVRVHRLQQLRRRPLDVDRAARENNLVRVRPPEQLAVDEGGPADDRAQLHLGAAVSPREGRERRRARQRLRLDHHHGLECVLLRRRGAAPARVEVHQPTRAARVRLPRLRHARVEQHDPVQLLPRLDELVARLVRAPAAEVHQLEELRRANSVRREDRLIERERVGVKVYLLPILQHQQGQHANQAADGQPNHVGRQLCPPRDWELRLRLRQRRRLHAQPRRHRLNMITQPEADDVRQGVPKACCGEGRPPQLFAQRQINLIARQDHDGVVCDAESDKRNPRRERQLGQLLPRRQRSGRGLASNGM
mmetsp:Transcript_50695/g.164288  ORF Transcript_50695/g.164288 Transcript_50695/m.164288 type:complete len:408 (-) Transcript_50695:175-1398(-)